MSQAFVVPIAQPFIGDEERREVLAVLDSGQLVQGAWVQRLEQRFADLHGARFAVATSSGTTALTAMLLAHGIGPGDEVVVPAFSFFATASSVLAVHATPVFADVDPSTFTLTAPTVEAALSPRTRAVLPVHLYGHPADLPSLLDLCRKRGVLLLEDAAQAHLASVDGKCVGAVGTAAFSLYASKNATSGEGGLVLTDDDAVAERLRRIRNHGRSRMDEHDTLGFNFRLTNLAAALCLPQLDRLLKWTQTREANAAFYRSHLRGVAHPVVRPGYRHVFHQYTVRAESEHERDHLLYGLHRHGIEARVYYPRPIHRQPIMKERGLDTAELPVTEALCRTVLSLPVHPQLTPEQLELVVGTVHHLLGI